MSAILGVLGILLGLAVMAAVAACLFMHFGAKLAKVENATFGKAVIAAFVSSLLTCITTVVFSILPVIGTILGFLVGMLLALVVIKVVYSLTFGKALLVWVFNAAGMILAVMVAFLTFAGALVAILRH
jgi:hypothetical protein